MSCLLMLVALAPIRADSTQHPKSVRYASGRVRPARAAASDQIIGRWYFPKRASDIEIYQENGLYFGKIVAVNEATTAEFGAMNNKMLMTNLTFAKNEWAGGQLIHPQTGNRFDVFLTLADANTLVVTAYKGCRLFSKTYKLTRM
ncbi:MAG: DUF2147 domain-containing protein [Bacteroidetes bacterium]|nr:DUF2147 domain-containing protein [Fibrella sp.]